jgi:hypothetical protein
VGRPRARCGLCRCNNSDQAPQRTVVMLSTPQPDSSFDGNRKILNMNMITVKKNPPAIIRTQPSTGTSIRQPSQNTPAAMSAIPASQR